MPLSQSALTGTNIQKHSQAHTPWKISPFWPKLSHYQLILMMKDSNFTSSACVKEFWVYILQCDNNSFYTGYTDDLEKRYRRHIKGTASKYTRSFKPVCVLQCWRISGGKALAMNIERDIKKKSRPQKLELILHPYKLSTNPLIQPLIPLPSFTGLSNA